MRIRLPKPSVLPIALALAFLAAACGAAEPGIPEASRSGAPTPTMAVVENTQLPQTAPAPTGASAATNVRVDDPTEYPFSPLIPFDGIPPVYDPQFASAANSPLTDDELVMGVVSGGEAKAYPITVLRSREMVNDELGGIPILVTW